LILPGRSDPFLDIIDKIEGIDCYLKDIKASRPVFIANKFLKQVEMKRDVSHKLNLPKRKSNHFSLLVTDKISFTPNEGPFEIEVVIGAFITLVEPMRPAEIVKLIGEKKNLLSIINQCLPHSSAIIALITDKMGFSPVIFSSRIVLEDEEHGDESRISDR